MTRWITSKAMKKIQFLSALLMVAMLTVFTSCDSDSFKIDGNLAGIEGNKVRIVFQGDTGIVDGWSDVDKKGHFAFKGEARQPVLVNVLTINGEPLIAVVATNGDHVKLNGDAARAMGVHVKGTRLNEQWQLFRNEHLAFYTDPNPSRLDAAIEKYVREHPRDMLSTVLLVADYSDYSDNGKMSELLRGIDQASRPQSLTMLLPENSRGRKSANLPRLMSLTLAQQGGVFREVQLTGRMTLLALWANPSSHRSAALQPVIDMGNESARKFRVIDILAEADTLRWHQTIAADPADWQHYWAPEGPMDQGIQLLGINILPWFAVTDSTGLVTYSGPNLSMALTHLTPVN